MEEKPSKVCGGCKQPLPLSDFYFDKRRGIPYSKCKTCWKTGAREWSKNNPIRRKAISLKCANRKNIERYGITAEEYAQRASEQGHVCAICKKPESRVVYGKTCRLAIDHDHATGRVRALLCVRCNGLLGLAGDDVALLKKAIQYLRQHRR